MTKLHFNFKIFCSDFKNFNKFIGLCRHCILHNYFFTLQYCENLSFRIFLPRIEKIFKLCILALRVLLCCFHYKNLKKVLIFFKLADNYMNMAFAVAETKDSLE